MSEGEQPSGPSERNPDGKLIYEDGACYVLLAEKGGAEGHVLVYPREPYDALEKIPDDVMIHMVTISSYAATAVFEGLGAGGTNIIMHNGGPNMTTPRPCFHVIPRSENDGMNFLWEPKEIPPGDMDGAASAISDEAFFVGKKDTSEDAGSAPTVAVSSEGKKVETIPKSDEDYRLKQLYRPA